MPATIMTTARSWRNSTSCMALVPGEGRTGPTSRRSAHFMLLVLSPLAARPRLGYRRVDGAPADLFEEPVSTRGVCHRRSARGDLTRRRLLARTHHRSRRQDDHPRLQRRGSRRTMTRGALALVLLAACSEAAAPNPSAGGDAVARDADSSDAAVDDPRDAEEHFDDVLFSDLSGPTDLGLIIEDDAGEADA